MHSSVVHKAAIKANAEVLSTVPIVLMCAVILTVDDLLTSNWHKNHQNQSKITCLEHCKCSGCNVMQPCCELSNIQKC